jgi:steroid 5-alpha reductase family enzyme
MVNGGADRRFADFKRVFEASPKPPRQIPAAFGLTGAAAMLIKMPGNRRHNQRQKAVRNLAATSLILVTRRTAVGG